MEVIHSRCSGLDVHKETVVACVRLAAGDKVTREVKSFETPRSGLLSLLAWLREQVAAMSPWKRPECTGARPGSRG